MSFEMEWSPDSWRARTALQQPEYPDPAALETVLAELRQLPPLVTSWEIVRLQEQLAEAARGERFVLQGGDCAERLMDCRPARITNALKVLLQMSLVLVVGARRPVTRIGRFAGQYAKPRSANEETRNGLSLPSYRGDIINRPEFSVEARTPDPQLLLRGYERAALKLNFIRALVKGGFADLHHPEYFDLDWVEHSPLADEYHRMAQTISDALGFMENVLGVRAGDSDRIDFFTAHEALHLGYESAQTRQVPRRPGFFNLTTHFPWVGLRTNDPYGCAHRIPARHREPGWHQGGLRNHAGAGGRLDRPARSAARAGAPDPDSPLRRHPHRRGPAAADRSRPRRRRARALGVRSDARQHPDHLHGHKDALVRRHPLGSRAGLRYSRAPWAESSAACTWS